MSTDPQTKSAGAPLNCKVGGALFAVIGAAGLTGAAGVALAAVAAHKVSSPALATAATMLMVHAAAALAIAAISTHVKSGWRWLITAGLMLSAVVLFSGAVSYHAVMGEHMIAMAAPFGGSMLIASWCALAVLAVFEALRK